MISNSYLFLHAVAVDSDGSPVTVSWSGDSRRNIIVWMDHRAVEQTERINLYKSPVLQYCGGSLSPEMQPPKVQITESLFILLLWFSMQHNVGVLYFDVLCIYYFCARSNLPERYVSV